MTRYVYRFQIYTEVDVPVNILIYTDTNRCIYANMKIYRYQDKYTNRCKHVHVSWLALTVTFMIQSHLERYSVKKFPKSS